MIKKLLFVISTFALLVFAFGRAKAADLQKIIGEPYRVKEDSASPKYAAPSRNFEIENNHVKDEVIVKFKPEIGVTSSKANQDIASLAEAKVKRADPLAKFVVVKLPKNKKVKEAVEHYNRLKNVEYAEPNYIVRASWSPNDPFFGFQWHFSKINMTTAWDYDVNPPLHGGDSSVIAAVLDTGVAYENYDVFAQAPDLASTSFAAGWDFINSDSHPNDDNGHGTHVAGTIAQSTDNSIGVAGMAFHSKIMPVKVLDANGSGSIDAIVSGLAYAKNNGAKVINMSLGTTSFSQALQDAIKSAYDAGVILACASGNGGADGIGDPELDYPARFSECIGVGATRFDNTRSPYSNYGANLTLVAPGGDTSVDQNGDGYVDGVLQNTFSEFGGTITDPTSFAFVFSQGTSMATPHVAGAAALLLASGVPASSVRDTLTSSATDLGAAGYDQEYGSGLLNMSSAIAYPAISSVSPNFSSNNDQTNITITGTNFASNALSGTIDSLALSNVSFVNATTVMATVPSHLSSGTYDISLTTGGKTATLQDAFVVLDPSPDSPSKFRAAPSDKKILLAWSKPDVWDFAGVKILRKASGFPSNQNDGKVVYQGKKNSVIDKKLKNGKRYYYAAFAYDTSGNYSSSATLRAAPGESFLITSQASGKGKPVLAYDKNGKKRKTQFTPFGINYNGEVRPAAGDVDGDGYDEIILGTGSGHIPEIKIFDGKGKEKGGFFPFGKSYRCGLYPAAGDVNGDGKDEIIAGLGSGCPSKIQIFNKKGRAFKKSSITPYSGNNGIMAAAGDFDGDGRDEIASIPARGAARVYIFGYQSKIKKVLNKKGFLAFPSSMTRGAEIFAGDVNFNKSAEIIVVPRSGPSLSVKVFNFRGKKVYKKSGFYPYGSGYKNGLYMTVSDLNSDGYAEILTMKKSESEVSVFSYRGQKSEPRIISKLKIEKERFLTVGRTK